MELKTFYNVYETMYESVRLTTFTNWKSKFLTKEEASKEGWVECRSKGEIKLQCVFCGSFRTLELKNPSMKDSLKKSHHILCPIFCSHPTGNVPLFTDNLDEAETYKFLENYLKERKENKHICMGYKPGYGESEQNFAYPYKRQETFKNWPLDFFPESLIEAGFFYTGLSDFVVCYICGGGLYNWSSDDDPKKKHETYYSTCPFITLKDEAPSENTFRALTDYEKDLLLNHPIGKFMTELLQDSDVKIKETLASFLTKYGVMPITVGQAISFMTMNKDQYDADFRKEMKFGNHRATFVSFAEDMSERLIYASELKSKDFKQMAKISENHDSNIIKDSFDVNHSKFMSKKCTKIINSLENFEDSACQGLTSTRIHTAGNETSDVDPVCQEFISNTNASAGVNDEKIVVSNAQTFEIVIIDQPKEHNYTASSTVTCNESCVDLEPTYFDSAVNATLPYIPTGNLGLDLGLESFCLNLDAQNNVNDFGDCNDLLNLDGKD